MVEIWEGFQDEMSLARCGIFEREGEGESAGSDVLGEGLKVLGKLSRALEG